jgi:hypothetical protein
MIQKASVTSGTLLSDSDMSLPCSAPPARTTFSRLICSACDVTGQFKVTVTKAADIAAFVSMRAQKVVRATGSDDSDNGNAGVFNAQNPGTAFADREPRYR